MLQNKSVSLQQSPAGVEFRPEDLLPIEEVARRLDADVAWVRPSWFHDSVPPLVITPDVVPLVANDFDQPLNLSRPPHDETTTVAPFDKEIAFPRIVYVGGVSRPSSSGKIPPASQTSALWGLRVPPPVPEKLPPSEPRLLTRIQTAKAAIRVGRLRNFVGSDEEQTPELVKEWNARLAKALKEDDPGACTRPEIVRVNVDRTKIAASKLARLECQATRRGHKREIQDAVFGVERISGFEFDGINYNGVRKTTRAVPNDVNRRSEYQKKYRHVIPYNPLGRGRTEEAEQALRNHADFLLDAARNEIQMTNAPIVEVAERMGIDYDWLRKQLSRGNQTLDLCKTNPNAAVAQEILGSRKDPIPAGFNIGVRLNKRVEIKYLGALTDSPQQHLKALLRLKKASVKDALKYERKQARKNGWNSEQSAAAEQAARARVEEAYRLPFQMFQSEIEGGGGTPSQFPHKVEGKAVQVRPQPHAGTI